MIIFVADAFSDNYAGGAELTSDAIIEASLLPVNKVLSTKVNLQFMEKYQNCFWIFGNYSSVDQKCLLYAAKNLDYCIIEYDYKFCKYRSIKKHEHAEGKCDCHTKQNGKLVAAFMAKSKMNFWMSEQQKNIYQNYFPFIKNNTVLSSVFDQQALKSLKTLNTKDKNNKWLILNSNSWIKGRDAAVKYAEENNLDYELVWGLKHSELLKKLASSKGLIFLPLAHDTCPRIVIEARALDCELVTNSYVQHFEEDWFSSKSKILSYLEKRAEYFWDVLHELISEKLKIANKATQSERSIKIVVPFYNASEWLSKCIDSIKKQKYKKFQCYFIDDMSTDDSYATAKAAIAGDKRFVLIKNKNKYYALENIVRAINKANCNDEDVILLLDGDDWLSSRYTLSTLLDYYEKDDCMLTYGSYVYNPGGTRGIEPSRYPAEVVSANTYRDDMWRASHLRSFTYNLWKNLDHKDLKDKEGNYYKMAYDQAIMLPLLEMASERSKYIEETMYVYNKANPLNVDKIKAQQQFDTAKEIRAKERYKRI
jgi:hypothetical protein